jgi:hypothetical protein
LKSATLPPQKLFDHSGQAEVERRLRVFKLPATAFPCRAPRKLGQLLQAPFGLCNPSVRSAEGIFVL